MEWGTFITVIVALYLAWYGLNFLFDLFIGGRNKIETEPGVHFDVKDLMAEEEKPQQVLSQDYEDKVVKVHKKDTPAPKKPADGSGQSIASSASAPVVVQPSTQPQDEAPDWASVIDLEEEKTIEISVQSQPVSVNSFIQALKDEAKVESSSITF